MIAKLSVIIVNYNGFEETINCLQSLSGLDYPNFDIIVIDNGSTNSSFEEIKQFLKNVDDQLLKLKTKLIKAPRNLGFAGGCNLGIKTAKNADYYFLLNPDTEVEQGTLREMINIAEKKQFKGKKIGFLGPRILYQDKKTIYSNGGYINKNLIKATLKDHGKTEKELTEKSPFKTDYITGTALLVSQNVINDVGLMDERYFLYYEDSDWSFRAKKKGYIHLIIPKAILYHKGYHSTEYLSFNYIYYLIRNGYYLAWWNGGTSKKIFVLIYSFYKLTKQIFKMLIPSKRKWIKPITKATIDFWRGKYGQINS